MDDVMSCWQQAGLHMVEELHLGVVMAVVAMGQAGVAIAVAWRMAQVVDMLVVRGVGHMEGEAQAMPLAVPMASQLQCTGAASSQAHERSNAAWHCLIKAFAGEKQPRPKHPGFKHNICAWH